MRKTMAVVAVLALGLPFGGVVAEEDRIPHPEPGFANPRAWLPHELPEEIRGAVPPEPGTCIRDVRFSEGLYEAAGEDPEFWGDPDPYGESCTRLRFAYGPIVARPGINDTELKFKTIEKPWYDGYMVRIEPNLLRPDGSEPPIDEIHLHHGTWLSSPDYGNGPFFAAGEEKTVAQFPRGYGMPVLASDIWYFVHMIHNETTRAEVLWVTYDIDYVEWDAVEDLGIKPIRPFWLDVWKNAHRSTYPVYNTHRGYGEEITDELTLGIVTPEPTDENPNPEPFTTRECAWPRDECGAFDSWNQTDVGQGTPGNGKGTDIYVPASLAGTAIGLGGHLHPGGLRVEIDAVRCVDQAGATVAPIRPGNTITSWAGLRCPETSGGGPVTEDVERVFTSDAEYFDGYPASWNFRMTVNGAPFWQVDLEEHTMLRINSVYETELGSWYEGMGIAVVYIHPYNDTGRYAGSGEFYGTDPFATTTDIVNDKPLIECLEDAGPNTLCTRGVVTRDEPPGSTRRGGDNQSDWVGDFDLEPSAAFVDEVAIGAFGYYPGDLGTVSVTGIPKVHRTEGVAFRNLDAATGVFHSVTACAYPCNGQTGIDYPVADFGWGRADLVAAGEYPYVTYDSGELGYSTFLGPARGWLPSYAQAMPSPTDTDAWLEWAEYPTTFRLVPEDLNLRNGEVYTYFCRIHPFMRGAFTVDE